MAREHRYLVGFLIPALLFLAVFFGYPLLSNVAMGFQQYTAKTFFTGQAPWVGFANYAKAFASTLFAPSLLNTALFTVGSILGQFGIGLALALFFCKKFPLNNVLRALLLLPWLLPLIVSSATWRSILDRDSGILNAALQYFHLVSEPVPWLTSPDVALLAVLLVNIWVGIPFNVTILHAGLQAIPEELYEAAALDGATGLKSFRHITWPCLRPVVSVVLILGVIYTIKVLDIILGLTNGGPANSTQTLTIRAYQESFVRFDFGVGAAYGNILILISLVFAVIYLFSNRKRNDA
ncbi:sugar ABC transporter permease [Verminephrobacter aporrectodeae subsp. tuberculatae]|uniref:Sugar ABC transporter permease n=1 Tax=Verminephrobacter aporrectodeae subsp. tuberculatae TaxID=1110392 RepID=A0ABT3KNT2_9BURK|nr:sugar ABC transporter permease [Verminephrobacter aporrectodeae]MCW5221376.1 sugar ABC transporter permease [Verminephrobacter aporrectodeae subsp. tuberculatae]MCW5290667.1 sugar ABC transporter permease [Verminephrobacter aporrectodeae subsp. tuberculatae]MCW5319974.1 sugar ABC transporter permease [Verminephrobacter aporrectodeae subsp. tuberculatae]MCW8200255.1 sugar ABC transporter permease [Verminephrobacter aporrectodeae subsp. tuberculatae]MCW8208652.1 sugar ABC transporter permease